MEINSPDPIDHDVKQLQKLVWEMAVTIRNHVPDRNIIAAVDSIFDSQNAQEVTGLLRTFNEGREPLKTIDVTKQYHKLYRYLRLPNPWAILRLT